MNVSPAAIVAILLALAGTPPRLLAAPPACIAHSVATTPHLIELYTSEGCSSCPPAENWLDGLAEDARVIALEFHVDYWDALGWPDRFASARWTARQNALAARSPSHIVYTPEVALDGREWRQWSRASLPPAAAAPLPLDLEITRGNPLQARLSGPAAGAPLQAYYAIIESGLTSIVRSGENAGRTLRHANVVRALAGPLAPGQYAMLDAPADLAENNAAVVGFLTDAQGTVLSSIRLALPGCR